MSYYNYGEPIELIVDSYFKRKLMHERNGVGGNASWMSNSDFELNGARLTRAEPVNDALPEIPCTMIRDSSNRVVKVIYGEVSALASSDESDPVIWQEELIRDASGRVVELITTYPDGETLSTRIVRTGGLVTDYEYS